MALTQKGARIVKIDKQELDDYITQEPDWDENFTAFGVWKDEWKGLLEDARFELGRLFRSLWKMLVNTCPDCRKPKEILWFQAGKHDDCLPF